MSEKVIEIHPYRIKDNLLLLIASVELAGIKEPFLVKDSHKLNLYNVELPNGKLLIPRATSNSITIKIGFVWKTKEAKQELLSLVKTGENPEDVFAVRLRASCHKTFWSSAQKVSRISEVGKKDIEISVSMSDVAEQVFIESYITREIPGSRAEHLKATSALSIVSTNDELSIQIDELETIGGNHLPIKPLDLKDLLFKVTQTDADSMPVIYYSNDFEKLFRCDDLIVVNTAFLMIMPALIDQYLKWLLFVARADQTDKEQKSLVDKIARLTGITKDDLYDLMDSSVEDKLHRYLDLSQKLFQGIQHKTGINYKKELDRYINLERRLKSEPI